VNPEPVNAYDSYYTYPTPEHQQVKLWVASRLTITKII
jgi:hypothetical protein